SALLLAQAFEDAGQPAGWLNVIVGKSRDIGDVLTGDERVRMITFTGSSEVGWGIRQRANKKKVSLELGNSTPVIVLADADLDRAAGAIALNGYAFAGQSCISVQRVYVEDSVHDALMERLVPKVEALKVGDPLDPDTQVGPVIDAENRDRIKAWIDEAVSQGAKLAAGGELDDGGLLRPTLLDEVSLDMKVSCNEVFGPVVTVARVSGLDQAIEMANGTIYGLQAGVFTTNLPAAMRAARELEFGGVTLNEAPTFRADQMPYGGVKESGNTREGPRFAVQEMTEPRMVVIQL
ncbi:MAG TPA: aldehyde dehydrogenase family protein, partial [Gaiellales bacterium]|nr:aldehyde dehydrogenase family protein [Gaiellales bacterium]